MKRPGQSPVTAHNREKGKHKHKQCLTKPDNYGQFCFKSMHDKKPITEQAIQTVHKNCHCQILLILHLPHLSKTILASTDLAFLQLAHSSSPVVISRFFWSNLTSFSA